MKFAELLKQAEKFTIDNSPALLTGVGVTGAITTAYLAARAAFRVGLDINAGHYEPLMEGREPEVYTTTDLIKTYWKPFIPAAITGSLTVTAIIAANQVGTRRAAAMATAYSLSERAFSEYKDKVVEKIGDNKARAVRDEVAQDRVNSNPPQDSQVIITGGGEVLCYDHFTGRYFKSDMETLRRAENEINRLILDQGYASVSDLYSEIGLPPTSFSEEVGWNTDRMLTLVFSTTLSPDGRPCISIDFDLHPNRKYAHFAGE